MSSKTKRVFNGSARTNTPTVFLYNRVSHLDSVKSGLGLEAGADSIIAYCKSRMMSGEIKGELHAGGWQGGKMTKAEDITSELMMNHDKRSIEVDEPRGDGFFIDLAVSSFKHRLIERPAGFRLCQLVRPGDHIIFSKPDRAFRNSADCSQMVQEWRRRDITAHFSSFSIDTSTPVGAMFIQLCGVFAEWESTLRSERVSESYMRAMIRGTLGKTILGWRTMPGSKRRVPDDGQRQIMRRIVHLRENEGMSWDQISDAVSAIWHEWGMEKKTRNVQWVRQSTKERFWTKGRVEAGYLQAYVLQLVPGPMKQKINSKIGRILWKKHHPNG